MNIEYLSPEEYARRFNVKKRTVYRWCESKVLTTLPKRRGSRLIRIVVGPAERGEVLVAPVKNNVVEFRGKI